MADIPVEDLSEAEAAEELGRLAAEIAQATTTVTIPKMRRLFRMPRMTHYGGETLPSNSVFRI